jgi:nitric oxide reductase activation protein
MLSVTAVRPRYHTTEEGRWDYKVTIVFKNLAAAHDPAAEEAVIKQLYPDQATFRREEQRRFEILLSHWDVPLVNLDLNQ